MSNFSELAINHHKQQKATSSKAHAIQIFLADLLTTFGGFVYYFGVAKNGTTTRKEKMKRKFIWVPRPLWLALYKEGRVPPSAQRGRLVKVGVSSDRAPELRRLVSAYKQKLQRYTESAAQDVIEDFAA